MSNKLTYTMVAIFVVALGFFAVKNQQANNPAAVIDATTPSETTTIRVADLPVTSGLPFYVALEKGYFKEAGLNIEYVKLDSPNILIDALVSDQVDMTSPSGAMGIAGIAEYRNPGTLKIYAAVGGDKQTSTESLVVPPNSSISSFGDLQGKSLGILPGIQWRTISKHLLAAHGLEVGTDVQLVELAPGLQVGALKGEQIDALLAIEPMAMIAAHAGMKEVVRAPNAAVIADPFYPGAGIVRSDFADNNPETVRKFIDCIGKAIEDIESNPDDARQYLAGYTPLTEDLIPGAPLLIHKLYQDFTEQDIEAIEKFHHIFTTEGVIDGEINTRGMIFDSPDHDNS